MGGKSIMRLFNDQKREPYHHEGLFLWSKESCLIALSQLLKWVKVFPSSGLLDFIWYQIPIVVNELYLTSKRIYLLSARTHKLEQAPKRREGRITETWNAMLGQLYYTTLTKAAHGASFYSTFWKKDLSALFPLKSYEVEYWYPASTSEAKELASISSAKREDSAGDSVRLG